MKGSSRYPTAALRVLKAGFERTEDLQVTSTNVVLPFALPSQRAYVALEGPLLDIEAMIQVLSPLHGAEHGPGQPLLGATEGMRYLTRLGYIPHIVIVSQLHPVAIPMLTAWIGHHFGISPTQIMIAADGPPFGSDGDYLILDALGEHLAASFQGTVMPFLGGWRDMALMLPPARSQVSFDRSHAPHALLASDQSAT
jgi:hypothetical protein